MSVDRVISRLDPYLDIGEARMSVGRDGNVYLTGGQHGGRFLRVAPDGSHRTGVVGQFAVAVTANADGVVASAEGNTDARVGIWDRNFKPLRQIPGFFDHDPDCWSSPSDVQAGRSGDFYAIDPYRDPAVVVRVPGAAEEQVISYSLPLGYGGGKCRAV